MGNGITNCYPDEVDKFISITVLTIPVPDQGELRAGTLKAIIRRSGLPRSAFE